MGSCITKSKPPLNGAAKTIKKGGMSHNLVNGPADEMHSSLDKDGKFMISNINRTKNQTFLVSN
jgi:hypothetical protein